MRLSGTLGFLILIALLSPNVCAKQKAKSPNSQNNAYNQHLSISIGSPIIIQGVTGEELKNIEIHLGIETNEIPRSSLGLPRSNNFIIQKTELALRGLGYYQPQIKLSGDHNQWILNVVSKGDAVKWRTTEFQVSGDAKNIAEIMLMLNEHPFVSGKQLHHGEYSDFKNKIQTKALVYGLFNFKFLRSERKIDKEKNEAFLVWEIESGPRFKINSITIEGSSLSNEFLERYLSIKQGDSYYQPDSLKSHRMLNRSGYFSDVFLEQDINYIDHTIAIKFLTTDINKYELKLSAGYGTDSGAKFSVNWQDRRATDNGRKYSVGLNTSEIEQAVYGQYRTPLSKEKNEWLNRLSYQHTDDELADVRTLTYDSTLAFKHNENWSSFWSVTVASENIENNLNIANELDYIVPSIKFEYVSEADPFFAQQGWRWQQVVRFGNKALSEPEFDFVQVQQQLKSIWCFTSDWRFIMRSELGYTSMEEQSFNRLMPTSYRFFAGGDISVRGYDFQSLSPVDQAGVSLGARHLLTLSLEIDRRFAEDFRWAVFYDKGNAFNDWSDMQLRSSVGVGLRWITPIGSIRFDYAKALDDLKDNRWHITIGPDL